MLLNEIQNIFKRVERIEFQTDLIDHHLKDIFDLPKLISKDNQRNEFWTAIEVEEAYAADYKDLLVYIRNIGSQWNELKRYT